jgi:hypothetical protein
MYRQKELDVQTLPDTFPLEIDSPTRKDGKKMLSLQKCHHGLSALTNSVLIQLNPIVTRRSSMLFSVVPLLVLAIAEAAPSVNCSDPFVVTLVHGLGMIIGILEALGVAIAVIGIVVGGLMRATAWGSEQRIAMSNKAITCAVIGLVIVLVGVTLGGQIPNWFNSGGSSSCSNFS